MNRPPITDTEIRLQAKMALGRAVKYSVQIRRRCGWPQDVPGYQSAALLGVAMALRKFDATKGVKFATFCYACVTRELFHERRNQDPRPAAQQEARIPPEDYQLPPLSLDTLTYDEDPFIDQVVDGRPGPEALALGFEEAEEAALIVAGLSPLQREAVQLRLWDDMTFTAIGERLGIPRQTAEMRYSRALRGVRASGRSVSLEVTAPQGQAGR